MLERTDAIMNEVLDPITFVLAYPTVHGITSMKAIIFSFIYKAMRKTGHRSNIKETMQ